MAVGWVPSARWSAGRHQLQRAVWPALVVVGGELAEDAPQVPFIHDDHVVEAFPPQGPHQPLGDSVRLWCRYRREHGLDAEAPRPRYEVTAIRTVAVANQEARARTPRRSSPKSGKTETFTETLSGVKSGTLEKTSG